MLGINVNELVNIYLTGRNGSGKTNLANVILALSDEEKVFKQTWRDNDQQVFYYEIGNIRLYDLPGIVSGYESENINRASLLLPQIDDEFECLQPIKEFELSQYYLTTKNVEIKVISVFEWQSIENQKYVAPDTIIYVQPPHRAFLSDDRKYLRDLLKFQKQSEFENKFIFLLNIFYNQHNIELATQQNIEDAKQAITRVYQQFYADIPSFIEVNLLNKNGIDKLIFLIQERLQINN